VIVGSVAPRTCVYSQLMRVPAEDRPSSGFRMSLCDFIAQRGNFVNGVIW